MPKNIQDELRDLSSFEALPQSPMNIDDLINQKLALKYMNENNWNMANLPEFQKHATRLHVPRDGDDVEMEYGPDQLPDYYKKPPVNGSVEDLLEEIEGLGFEDIDGDAT